MKRIAWLCLVLTLIATAPGLSQVNVGHSGKLSTTVFADYYWVALNHDSDIEGNNGFWFRRIYFTYDHQISDAFSGRLRLEMNSEGDFETDSDLTPQVKDAYVKWANENHSITGGISPTPIFGLTEDVWGYRSVEKSPQDLYDFGSSRDFGLTFKGNIDPEGRLKYHFMVGNGSSTGTELNQGKKFFFALSYYISDHWVIQAYGDLNDAEGNQDTYTAQGFIGYQSEMLNFGALYAYQLRENAAESGDLNLDLASFFANTRLSDKISVFGRVDHLFDPNPTGPGNDYIPFSDQAESTFLTTGIDVALNDSVHLMPNIEAVIYGESNTGIRPENDLIPRFTALVTF